MSAEPPVDPADPAVTVHVGDALVARIAAEAATGVPGVVGLRGDLAGALLELAGSVLRRRGPAAGVTARVDGRQADVTLGVVTRLGHNCRDVAQQVQRAVGAAVEAYTGLDVGPAAFGNGTMAWSADGRWLAVVGLPGSRAGYIWLIDPSGGAPPRQLLELPAGASLRGATWSRDGSSLFVGFVDWASDIVLFDVIEPL